MIYLNVLGGMCNRLRAIGSAMKLGLEFDDAVVVFWHKNAEMNCYFEDLYDDIIYSVGGKKSKIKIENIECLTQELWKEMEKRVGNRRCYNDTKDFEDDYINNKGKGSFFLSTCQPFYNFNNDFSWLVLKKELNKRIDNITKYFGNRCIGIHIRRTDNKKSIKYSPVESFINVMEKEIAIENNVKFYLATDDMEIKKYLLDRFGSRIIVNDSDYISREQGGMIDAVIDLFALSNTDKIYGSYNSSFSITAAYIGKKEFEIIMEIKSNLKDCEIMENNFLTFHDCVCVDGKLWAYFNRFSACFCINPITGSNSFEGWGKGLKKIGHRCSTVGIYKNFLISCSRFGDYVEILNLEKNERKSTILKYWEKSPKDEYYMYIVENRFILCSIYYRNIYFFDLDEIITADMACARKKLMGSFCSTTKPIILEGFLLLFKKEQAVIEVVNLKDYSCQKFEIDGEGIADLIVYEDKVFILHLSGDVAIYNRKTKQLLKFYKNLERNNSYTRFFKVMDKLWIFPSKRGGIFTIDLKTEDVTPYNRYPKDFQFLFSNLHPKYAAFAEDENLIYIGQRSANYMMLIEKTTGNEKWIQIKIEEEFFNDILPTAIIEELGTIVTEGQVRLDNFITHIKNLIRQDRADCNRTETVGKEIYKRSV